MKYSIFKDNDPVSTIKTIRNILSEINLKSVVEILPRTVKHKYMPYCHRIKLYGIDSFGVNGKGAKINNSLASAYGELMERLQNQYLIPVLSNDFYYAPDEKIIDIDSLFSNILNKYFDDKSLIKEIALLANRINKNYFKYSERYTSLTKRIDNENSTILVPFYNIKECKTLDLPIFVINKLQGTNGMCAGNTFEEALVEGLSEICERYSLKKILSNKLIMPDIPQQMYKKYEHITGLLNYYKENGYDIFIKDASLGKGIPVVCVIAHNKNEDLYHITFGSHPSLPVAIERNLTEISQGFDISNKNLIIDYYTQLTRKNFENEENNMKYLTEIIRMGGNILEENEYISLLLSNSNVSYQFDDKTWELPYEHSDNKKILDILLKRIFPITQNDIYIRNVSFLNFPSLYIFIPSMSIFTEYDRENVKKEINMLNWLDYAYDNFDQKELTINNLLKALEYRQIFGVHIFDKQFSEVPNECLSFLCSIVIKDYKRIEKYAEILIARSKWTNIFSDFGTFIFLIAIDYSRLKLQDTNDEKIKLVLSKKYSNTEINSFFKFFNSFTFSTLKRIIQNKKYFSETEKTLAMKEEYNKTAYIMGDLYLKNTPLQKDIEKIFKC